MLVGKLCAPSLLKRYLRTQAGRNQSLDRTRRLVSGHAWLWYLKPFRWTWNGAYSASVSEAATADSRLPELRARNAGSMTTMFGAGWCGRILAIRTLMCESERIAHHPVSWVMFEWYSGTPLIWIPLQTSSA